MIVKLFWYFFSLLTIFLVLISNPKSNGLGTSNNQNKVLSFRSSQVFIQRLICFSILMFFTFTLISLLVN
uniref:Protein-export membrane protein SecG n=1 Tax=Vertebrata lanosa TaxID=1261582 RepID=A0A0B5W5Q8_9FLOR|nr:protein-export membrane protein SecG [Vertebrata lanosa]AJH65946.1 protein-export membrane protein SecG [Vertebrata lanosa]